ncbi:MAG: selenide, water dikinase SelD [Spirochaetales bacterium]|uniref:Selenide, water dikinase n=1 Tax=Candidatus Thalassospirochaeta sargassi TaxID=3119039 RepID=A0AAJ1ICP6_9SPIO|nr:selenide, water dikinase SelD [Spirochaetales bacterium]
MSKDFDMMSTVEYGGCSAKLPASELEKLLADIPVLESERLLVGSDTHDDAMVWKINDETAIISTTDFFPPVCSDAYEFGQVAAANSLSDIYAMGGIAITALNLVMFPSQRIPMEVLRDMLRGGADKCLEAGVVIGGGHTIDDYPPKYGLAVTGTVHPERIITNSAAESGDLLILTKALGTGVLAAGKRIGEVLEEDFHGAVESMKQLNKSAAGIMQKYGVVCATDITGFSLLGHALKLARESGVSIEMDSTSIPSLPGAYNLLEYGCIPGAAFRNLNYVEDSVQFAPDLDYNLKMLAADAQTSGGILMCIKEGAAEDALKELRETYQYSAIIGRVKGPNSDGSFLILR